MLVKCPYCSYRGRQKQLPIHEKNCIYKKRALKKEYNGKAEQSLEYRIEKLKDFSYEIPGDLAKMSDIGFNDLLARFEDRKKRDDEKLAQKNQRLEEKKQQKANEKLEKERLENEDSERKKLEEENQIEQVEREKENFLKEQQAKLAREKFFDEQRKKNVEEQADDEPKKKRIRFLQ